MQVFSNNRVTVTSSVARPKDYAEISSSNESQETILPIEGIGLACGGSPNDVKTLKNGEIMRTIQVAIETTDGQEGHDGRGIEYKRFA